MLRTSRRGFLTGLGAMLAAPAIVHAGNLMPINSRLLIDTSPVYLRGEYGVSLSEIVTTTLRNRAGKLADNLKADNELLTRISVGERPLMRGFSYDIETDLRSDIMMAMLEVSNASH